MVFKIQIYVKFAIKEELKQSNKNCLFKNRKL